MALVEQCYGLLLSTCVVRPQRANSQTIGTTPRYEPLVDHSFRRGRRLISTVPKPVHHADSIDMVAGCLRQLELSRHASLRSFGVPASTIVRNSCRRCFSCGKTLVPLAQPCLSRRIPKDRCIYDHDHVGHALHYSASV
jgi:hypothetical protein